MDCYNDEFSGRNLICSSLRQRRVWASTAVQLLQLGGSQWREANLVTHDLALSVPSAHSNGHELFRLILLSSEDIDDAQTLARIRQLHHYTHGHNAALVFLLEQDGTTQPAMHQFMELSIKTTTTTTTTTTHFRHSPLPVIPLPSLTALPTTLETFISSFLRTSQRLPPQPPPVDAGRDLLPHCTVAGDDGDDARLSQRAVEMLRGGRCGGCLSFREMLLGGGGDGNGRGSVGLVATEEGREEMRRVLGRAEADGVGEFWRWEFAVPGATATATAMEVEMGMGRT